jgi:hypothetical protein
MISPSTPADLRTLADMLASTDFGRNSISLPADLREMSNASIPVLFSAGFLGNGMYNARPGPPVNYPLGRSLSPSLSLQPPSERTPPSTATPSIPADNGGKSGIVNMLTRFFANDHGSI